MSAAPARRRSRTPLACGLVVVAAVGLAGAGPFPAVGAPARTGVPEARDGWWRTQATDGRVELRVADHRVVAVLADVETTTVGAPDLECGRRTDAFVGPFTAGSRSTRRGFAVEAPPSSFRIVGRVASSTRMRVEVRVLASGADTCAARRSFDVRWAGRD